MTAAFGRDNGGISVRTIILAAVAIFFAAAGGASAQDFAFGAQFGTSGIGAQAQYRIQPGFVLRGNADWLSYGHDETYQDVKYSGTLEFATAGAFVDWHPFDSWFLVSAGGYLGQRDISLAAEPKSNININNVSYSPAQIGRLNGKVKYSSFQPFAGVGLDGTFYGDPGLTFDIVLGVAFGGSPAVSLDSTGGTLSGSATLQSNLAAERAKIEHDAADFGYYPILYFAVTYRL
jgi:hypothetical protein